jgi:hypothetical protein
MRDAITVEEAISRGNRIVKYPAILILIGIVALTLYLGIQKLIPGWCYPIGVVLAYGVALLWWKIMNAKWQRWAFQNVRNLHEFRILAVQEKLIGSDDNIFKPEDREQSNDEQQRITHHNRLSQKEIFEDDLTIPEETIIYYSKRKNIIGIAIMSICFIIGIFNLFFLDTYILGGITIFIGAYFGLKYFKNIKNKEPQIILNSNGVKTINTQFYKWANIRNEKVISEDSGRHIIYYLNYEHPDGVEHLRIDDYDTNPRMLSRLLILYRGRSKQKSMNHEQR